MVDKKNKYKVNFYKCLVPLNLLLLLKTTSNNKKTMLYPL